MDVRKSGGIYLEINRWISLEEEENNLERASSLPLSLSLFLSAFLFSNMSLLMDANTNAKAARRNKPFSPRIDRAT
jgi:hypothetical protein